MTATLIPVTDQVVVTWLRGLGYNVGTTLPEDQTKWAAGGFIQVTVVGGSPSVHDRLAKPVVQLDFWSVNTDSAKAPWGKANQLAEQVRKAFYDIPNQGVNPITITSDYFNARLLSAYFVTEPRRVVDSNQSFARYSADAQIAWTW